jgi:hypothetical protein
VPHGHKPTKPHKPKKKSDDTTIEEVKTTVNDWADQTYHWLCGLRDELDAHVHKTVPPAHQGTSGGKGEKSGDPTEKVFKHISDPPEPPYFM